MATAPGLGLSTSEQASSGAWGQSDREGVCTVVDQILQRYEQHHPAAKSYIR